MAKYYTRLAARIGEATPQDAQSAEGRPIRTLEGGWGPPRPHSRLDPAVARRPQVRLQYLVCCKGSLPVDSKPALVQEGRW